MSNRARNGSAEGRVELSDGPGKEKGTRAIPTARMEAAAGRYFILRVRGTGRSVGLIESSRPPSFKVIHPAAQASCPVGNRKSKRTSVPVFRGSGPRRRCPKRRGKSLTDRPEHVHIRGSESYASTFSPALSEEGSGIVRFGFGG